MSSLSSSASTLCERCRVLQINGRTPGCYEVVDDDGQVLLQFDGNEINLEYDLKDTLPDLPVLELSAVAGCQFCSLLKEVIEDSTIDVYSLLREKSIDCINISIEKLQYITSNHKLVRSGPQDARNGLYLLLVHFSLHRSSEISSRTVTFEILGNTGSPVTRYLGISRRPIDVYALTPRNVQQIRAWLNECNEEHVICSTPVDHYLPKRLLHIGNREGDNCRLVDTAEVGDVQLRDYRYIAYSYCWGSPARSPPPKTTIRTLTDRHSSISIDIMPQGFQDLITVARTVDVQYLWIDSLCIVQDDESDWRKESAQMVNIYRNAYLTIIAASTESPHQGFLYRKPSSRLVRVACVPSFNPGIEGFYLIGQYGPPRPEFVEAGEVYSNSRWSSRGWTLQEDRVSRRSLFFGQTQFYYHCQNHIVSEKCGTSSGSDNSPNPYVDWYHTVTLYNYRELTYPRDKLPAISALAETFAQATGDTYLAGLWKGDISYGLLWERTWWPLKVASSYHAPSWCWSAYDGHVAWRFNSRNLDICCSIIEAQTTCMDENVFGPVSGGYLRVHGKLAPATLSQAEYDPVARYDTALISGGRRIAHGQLSTAEQEATLVDNDNEVVWALLIAKAGSYMDVDGLKEVSCLVGLILSSAPRSGTADLEFCRVGIFKCPELESADFFDFCSLQEITIA